MGSCEPKNTNLQELIIHSSSKQPLPLVHNFTNSSPFVPNYVDHNQLEPYFVVQPEKLANLVSNKDVKLLHEYGGVQGIAEALKTNIGTGICEDETSLKARRQTFGTNQDSMNMMSPSNRIKGGRLSQIAMAAIRDGMPLLLLCSVVLSFVLDVKENGLEVAIVDQAFLVLPTIVVTNCYALIVWCLAGLKRQKEKDHVVVTVIRRGNEQKISPNEVVVGDVVCLKKGEIVPADGLLIDLNVVSISLGLDNSFQPFMYGGSKVLKGDCRMLVTAVGKETERSKMIMGLLRSDHPKQGLLLEAVDKMNSRVEKVMTSLSVMVLLAEVICCVLWNAKYCCDGGSNDGPETTMKNMIEEIVELAAKIAERFGKRANRHMATLCILIFSIRATLPFGILVIFACLSRRMASYAVKIRNLQACGTLGSVTTICISETGDLKLDYSKMVEVWIGLETIEDVSLDVMPPGVLNLLHEGIYMLRLLSPIEEALVQRFLDIDHGKDDLKQNCGLLFEDMDHKNLLRTKLISRSNYNTEDHDQKLFHVIHCSGPPKVLLSKCSHYFDRNGGLQTLDEPKREEFNQRIEDIEAQNFHSIAFAFQQVVLEENEVQRLKLQGGGKPKHLKLLSQREMTMVGMVGLKHPYCGHEIQQVIRSCWKSGTKVKLLLSKDFNIGKEIAIYSRNMKAEEEVVEFKVINASEFQNSSNEGRLTMIDDFQIMVNTSPMDTLSIIQCLKQKGEVVALMTSSSRDFPSLKEADVGCLITSMDAKSAGDEDCDVEISNMNFGCFFEMLELGRIVTMKVRKLIQLALTPDIAAFMINLISSLTSKRSVPLPLLQILWVGLAIHILPALAVSLSELPPSPSPVRIIPLVTRNMWKNVTVQVLYQGIVILVLHLKGEALMHADEKVVKAMILNLYILCQVFALLMMILVMEVEKRRGLKLGDDDKCQYRWLMLMILILGGGFGIITIAIHGESSLDVGQWCACVGLVVLSLAVDWITGRCH